jgi:hypothetical protein
MEQILNKSNADELKEQLKDLTIQLRELNGNIRLLRASMYELIVKLSTKNIYI